MLPMELQQIIFYWPIMQAFRVEQTIQRCFMPGMPACKAMPRLGCCNGARPQPYAAAGVFSSPNGPRNASALCQDAAASLALLLQEMQVGSNN